jgi:murein DD-endopeptidase MepM/ murein hydrolase activator NlpD
MKNRAILLSSIFVLALANGYCDKPTVHAAAPADPEPAPAANASVFDRSLSFPLPGATQIELRDTFNQARGTERRHEAADIMAPRNTPVLAVEDGIIRKLFLSKPGGITIYEFDPTQRFCYYYAHLSGYAGNLHEGMSVKRGQVIGYVGSTGNAAAESPHLHFGITILNAEKNWYGGIPIDPYPYLKAALPKR